MKPGELNVYLWQDGFHLFFPMRGKDRWRVIGILPKACVHETISRSRRWFPAIRREAGTDLSFKSCSWFSTYRIHHRAAERFRDRRCFLLGDAAHVHSPMGGQGMNTGLQDAYNLAWKLALVVKGRADAALLDTYEAGAHTGRAAAAAARPTGFQLVVSDSWIAGLFRTQIIARVAALAMTRERVREARVSHHLPDRHPLPQGPLSQTLPGLPKGAPLAGDRFPWLQLKFEPDGPVEDLFQKLDDTRFNLLVIGQPAPAVGTLGAAI